MKEEEKILKSVNKRGLTSGELERVLKSVENKAPEQKVAFSDYFGSKEKIGIISDSHIGHKEFDEPFWNHMVRVMKKEDVSRIYHVGDILEGMSGRDGHVYELSEVGFSQQIQKAEHLFNKLRQFDIFGINGNHDLWYQKKNNGGVNVSQELANRVENYNHCGDMEANIKIKRNKTMKLFHAGDGTAYAISYKMQKLMESFTGGEKPEVLLQGHYHKALYMFNRNIHGLDSGTLCGQTLWMRSKKIPAHKGFWIVDIELGKGGIGSFKPAFYPGYK